MLLIIIIISLNEALWTPYSPGQDEERNMINNNYINN